MGFSRAGFPAANSGPVARTPGAGETCVGVYISKCVYLVCILCIGFLSMFCPCSSLTYIRAMPVSYVFYLHTMYICYILYMYSVLSASAALAGASSCCLRIPFSTESCRDHSRCLPPCPFRQDNSIPDVIAMCTAAERQQQVGGSSVSHLHAYIQTRSVVSFSFSSSRTHNRQIKFFVQKR